MAPMGALLDRHVIFSFSMCHLRWHVLREPLLAGVTKKF
jgi:hypothetical protein